MNGVVAKAVRKYHQGSWVGRVSYVHHSIKKRAVEITGRNCHPFPYGGDVCGGGGGGEIHYDAAQSKKTHVRILDHRGKQQEQGVENKRGVSKMR